MRWYVTSGFSLLCLHVNRVVWRVILYVWQYKPDCERGETQSG